jgi:Dyp-type peroxidase family
VTDAAGALPVPWTEVQSVLLSGFPKRTWARFLMLRVTSPSRAKAFLGSVLDKRSMRFGWKGRHDGECVANIAFTREGLEALGLDDATLAGFSPEFLEGMTDPSRARKLRDIDDSDPSRWFWGYQATQVHLVLMLYTATDTTLATAVASYRASFAGSGLSEAVGPTGEDLGVTLPLDVRREHFGFADGIVQPRFRDEPPGTRSQPARDADRVAAGELLLGYPNEAGILPRSPVLSKAARGRDKLVTAGADFGRNGSYLVFRQLEQDVGAFWRSMALIGPSPTVEDRIRLAAKMVGRWPDGAALVTRPDPAGPRAPDPENFDYARDDPHGDRCPFGAHIRRTNPRATLSRDPDLGLAKSKKHRILRRGRSYGEPFVRSMAPAELIAAAEAGSGHPGPRGLHFLCFNADLANQFEFVQQTWINGSVFQGLHGEVDPLVGDPTVSGGRFSIPSEPLRRIECVQRFVQVRGGAYLFLPGRAALEYLAKSG